MKLYPRMLSIRWRLPATYAGIALLTTLALGVALLVPLRGYYQERERDFLERNAVTLAEALGPVLENKIEAPQGLDEHIRFLSLLSQVQVRLVDAQQVGAEAVLADSGLLDSSQGATITFSRAAEAGGMVTSWMVISDATPVPMVGADAANPVVEATSPVEATKDRLYYQSLTPETTPLPGSFGESGSVVLPAPTMVPFEQPVDRLKIMSAPVTAGKAVAGQPGDALISVVPVAGTMYGFALQTDVEREAARSDQVYRQPIIGSDGSTLGWVELSNGPAYGREIVTNVARGWLVASLVAVLLAGSVGWWVSRRMTAPLLALTGVTQRMAAGDLSARAAVYQADEIGSLSQSFNEMAERVEGTVHTLRRFASDAAHELHTPLTALRTNIELASGGANSDEYLRRAMEQVQRMEDMAVDLLDLSRIETGTLEVVFEPLSLTGLLRATCEPFASQAEQAGIIFDLDLPDGNVLVDGHRGQIQRAVTNLVENALKFTPPGGAVTVGLRIVAIEARVWVEDNGIGITPEDLPLLFNRFHRGRNAQGYPGSGLGLSIVRAIVIRHRGRVWAENQTGKTRFTLVFPLRNEEAI